MNIDQWLCITSCKLRIKAPGYEAAWNPNYFLPENTKVEIIKTSNKCFISKMIWQVRTSNLQQSSCSFQLNYLQQTKSCFKKVRGLNMLRSFYIIYKSSKEIRPHELKPRINVYCNMVVPAVLENKTHNKLWTYTYSTTCPSVFIIVKQYNI